MTQTLLETPEYLVRRPRRNRKDSSIRSLIQETRLHPSNLVAPLFIIEGQNEKQALPSLPGVYRYSVDFLIQEVQELYQLGIRAVDLFPIIPPERKDPFGSESLRPGNLLQTTLEALKREIPEMCLMVDIALDPYTDHGHDGLVTEEGEIDNDTTLDVLAEMSLNAADAGADVIAPSDMMDGRVAHIRHKLDSYGHTNVNILSYAAKYASALYGPFRDTLGSGLKKGDKKSYQMNPANVREALIECTLDELEGADFLMIKPALSYLDVIAKVREQTNLPIAAFHVSGEYAMVLAAAEKGWCDADKVLWEHLTAIKRAGADFILTYAAKGFAKNLLN
ncbi:MAG: Delta-aminolevulinic acid dehydratase [Chlamydiae bacterium]|nr:Delta-aminolevulinic acid dehydratase [Chlamydiota bacterium]